MHALFSFRLAQSPTSTSPSKSGFGPSPRTTVLPFRDATYYRIGLETFTCIGKDEWKLRIDTSSSRGGGGEYQWSNFNTSLSSEKMWHEESQYVVTDITSHAISKDCKPMYNPIRTIRLAVKDLVNKSWIHTSRKLPIFLLILHKSHVYQQPSKDLQGRGLQGEGPTT